MAIKILPISWCSLVSLITVCYVGIAYSSPDRSDGSFDGHGFKLKYTTGCGGIFKDFKGTITSPNYPENYPTNTVCKYEFIGKTGFLGSNIVRINFTEFSLESSSNCKHDYVTIYNGTSRKDPILGKYCGSLAPFSVSSSVSNIVMLFSSDKSKTNKGFSATYEILGCGEVLSTPSGSIASPNYPSSYPPNTVCRWRIEVAPGKRIQLSFTEIDLERMSCLYDFVKIFDGRDEVAPFFGKYCGRHGPRTMTSTTNELFIVFTADYSNAGRGFHLKYKSVSEACGGVFTLPHGLVRSPGYPNSYPMNTVCKWTIVTQPGQHIRINFTDYQLESESDASCEYDSLQIIDGDGNSATEIAKTCNGDSPGFLKSTSNVLVVNFRSDASNAGRGFFANYSTGCGVQIDADTPGVMTSPSYPNFYPHYTQCIWKLNTSLRKRITLTFTNFDLEFRKACDYDYVEIRDGGEANSREIGRFCGTSLPGVIRSTGNELYVKFNSNWAISRNGFKLHYTTSNKACGANINALKGIIASPRSQENKLTDFDCVWRIQVAPGSLVSLSFTSFNIIQSESCKRASVEVFNDPKAKSSLIGRYCGTSLPPKLLSMGNNLYIRFHHESLSGNEGFSANFSAVCNELITDLNGYIASPNWPSLYPTTERYPELEEFVWKIKLPRGQRIHVRFIDFDVEQSYDECHYDSLEIRDGGSSNSTMIGRYCGTTLPNAFSSTSNRLWLKFTSDHNTSGRGFKLFYQRV